MKRSQEPAASSSDDTENATQPSAVKAKARSINSKGSTTRRAASPAPENKPLLKRSDSLDPSLTKTWWQTLCTGAFHILFIISWALSFLLCIVFLFW
jgi:hypothetical protein